MDPNTENKLARLLLNLSNTIIQNRNRHLQALGLTASQADSLQYFLAHEGATISDLKDEMDITHQTAWGIVQRMEAHGWVRLQRSDEDRRRQAVIPTPSGRRLGELMIRNRERTGSLLLEGMTEEERQSFYRLAAPAYENVMNDWGPERYGSDQ